MADTDIIRARRDMVCEPVAYNDGYRIVTLKRGESLGLASVPAESGDKVVINERPEDHALYIYIGGARFAAYVYDPKFKKPYLGPILLSNGESVTRLDFETKEHPHQRSLIVAVGDVNGVDFWNEPLGCGVERHIGFDEIVNGDRSARFTAHNIWESAEGRPLLSERRTFTFYGQPPKCRYIDLKIAFEAEYGDIVFGATKEAGPLGIRVSEQLRADRGGYIKNSYGAEGEAECWGRSANWCAYSGKVGGLSCGVAVFDGEGNERYPTAWHVRDYGLFAANNLYFKGALTVKAGESLTYDYRICVFEGESEEGPDICGRFLNYVK